MEDIDKVTNIYWASIMNQKIMPDTPHISLNHHNHLWVWNYYHHLQIRKLKVREVATFPKVSLLVRGRVIPECMLWCATWARLKQWGTLEAKKVKPDMYHCTLLWKSHDAGSSVCKSSLFAWKTKPAPCLPSLHKQHCWGHVSRRAFDLLPGAEAPQNRCQEPRAQGCT